MNKECHNVYNETNERNEGHERGESTVVWNPVLSVDETATSVDPSPSQLCIADNLLPEPFSNANDSFAHHLEVILVSWGIAFFEYCFQVPANRIGSYEFTAAQLKTVQEVITLTVFGVFSVLYLKQPMRWNYVAGFALIVAAVAVIFKKW